MSELKGNYGERFFGLPFYATRRDLDSEKVLEKSSQLVEDVEDAYGSSINWEGLYVESPHGGEERVSEFSELEAKLDQGYETNFERKAELESRDSRITGHIRYDPVVRHNGWLLGTKFIHATIEVEGATERQFDAVEDVVDDWDQIRSTFLP